jgi:hypothetical protein
MVMLAWVKGGAPVSVMVPVRPDWKLIVSPLSALAAVIASRSEQEVPLPAWQFAPFAVFGSSMRVFTVQKFVGGGVARAGTASRHTTAASTGMRRENRCSLEEERERNDEQRRERADSNMDLHLAFSCSYHALTFDGILEDITPHWAAGGSIALKIFIHKGL